MLVKYRFFWCYSGLLSHESIIMIVMHKFVV